MKVIYVFIPLFMSWYQNEVQDSSNTADTEEYMTHGRLTKSWIRVGKGDSVVHVSEFYYYFLLPWHLSLHKKGKKHYYFQFIFIQNMRSKRIVTMYSSHCTFCYKRWRKVSEAVVLKEILKNGKGVLK